MEILRLGKEPISANQPAGNDVRYHPSFEVLEAEMDKASSPSSSDGVDWEKIVAISSDILANQSKDLLVASYLAVGLIHTRKHAGVADGLCMYRDLLETFWDDMYPPSSRMRARVLSVAWWLLKTEHALETVDPASFPSDQFHLASDALRGIATVLNQRCQDSPPLTPLIEFFSRNGPRDDPTRGNEPQQRALPGGIFPFQPPGSPCVERSTLPSDPGKILNTSLDQLGEAAATLWQLDLSNPLPYRLLRSALWISSEALPPATEGRTRIPPPDLQSKGALQDLRQKQNHEALLKAAEIRLSQCIFWLDLNRFTCEALEGLGPAYSAAREAVSQETAHLLARLPGLEELSFSDGTPFAIPETKQWLDGICATKVEMVTVADSEAPGPPAGVDAASIVAEARERWARGNLVAAVELLQERLTGRGGYKETLHWRLELVQFLLDAGKPGLALPQLEQVLADLDLYRLEQYDPLLALKGLKLVWAGYKSQGEQRFKEKAADTLHRIGRLAPAEMVRLKKVL